MTISEINHLTQLKKAINQDKDRLSEINIKINGLPPCNYTGVAHSGGRHDAFERLTVTKIDLESKISAEIIQEIREEIKLIEFIDTVPDSLTRIIIFFRFIDSLTWKDIARKFGGELTEDGVKRRCMRYIEATLDR